MKNKKNKAIIGIFLGFLIIIQQGCILGNYSQLSKKNLEIQERSRENNQSAIYLSQAAITNLMSVDLAEKSELIYPIEQSIGYLERNSLLLGLPASNQKNTVAQILSTNQLDRKKIAKKQEKDLDKEAELVQDSRRAKENLEGMGVLYEKEKNEEFWNRVKWMSIGFGTLALLGGILALPFVFPPLAGILVGVAPSLSSLLKVVPKSVLENKVKGIAEIRASIKSSKELNQNTLAAEIHEEIEKMIKEKLLQTEDTSDKSIIDYLRNKIK